MNLKIKDVTKSFGKTVVLEKLSYDFPSAGSVAVIGPSGSGKTTLLRIISGLDNDYIGDVVGAGFENVSFSFQEYRLFPTISALDNVLVAKKDKPDQKIRDEAAMLLFKLGFTVDDLSKKPDELSGGMKQRVSLARAFFKSAEILILDEPTKELDVSLVNTVRNMIKDYSSSHLVIFTSHSSEDIDALADHRLSLT